MLPKACSIHATHICITEIIARGVRLIYSKSKRMDNIQNVYYFLLTRPSLGLKFKKKTFFSVIAHWQDSIWTLSVWLILELKYALFFLNFKLPSCGWWHRNSRCAYLRGDSVAWPRSAWLGMTLLERASAANVCVLRNPIDQTFCGVAGGAQLKELLEYGQPCYTPCT